VALLFAIGAFTYPMEWWHFAVIVLPATLGAWLMARTTRATVAATTNQTGRYPPSDRER
jgi:D-alanyl-D-alanine dipeptidase